MSIDLPSPIPLLLAETTPNLKSTGKAVFQCPHCSHSSSRRNNLDKHITRRHPMQAGKQRVDCHLCGTAFFEAAKLQKHKCSGAFKPPVIMLQAPAMSVPAAPAAVGPEVWAPVEPIMPPAHVESVVAPVDSSASHLLSDADIDRPAVDFIAWWQEAALTPLEQTVKKRRGVLTTNALNNEKAKLRHIVRTVHNLLPGLFASGVYLQLVVQQHAVETLFADIFDRGLIATEYPAALMLKKICIWLCSRQSRDSRTFVSPDTFPAWGLINQHAQSGGRERKYSHKARAVYGTDQHKSMIGPEITAVLNACLARLHELEFDTEPDARLMPALVQDWMDHFATALLLACIPPRQGTYQHLTVNDVLPPGADARCPTQYSMKGRHDKVVEPWWTAVPPSLTAAMRFHLERVLPPGPGPLFLQRAGQARADFSYVTKRICERYIGRPITAGKFRKSVATNLNGRPGVNSRSLALLMGHSEETQRQWYHGIRYAEELGVCQEQLMQGVVVPQRN